jgi:hypothetical protein
MDAPEPQEVEAPDKTFAQRTALTTAIDAVMLAMASVGGSNATKELLLAR